VIARDGSVISNPFGGCRPVGNWPPPGTRTPPDRFLLVALFMNAQDAIQFEDAVKKSMKPSQFSSFSPEGAG
jgi:hypothetical protein